MVADVSKGRMYLAIETSGIFRPTRQAYTLEYQNLERQTYVRHSSMPTDGQTDRYDEADTRFSQFCERF
jgi:hypothetical protein